ncbi:MAG: dienelactone hydrolase family protein [Armatimonadetes bacterium]|nr:dienelactone hydrolase family protein [Armatimonadota bacterium]MBS1711040.1 dienelactone hydrolase family protein [Armatimonadota bacterium]MBX3108712.1 dienelactone hydrolase family protein [Fimbriimonadaceae bacterium]
MASGFLDFAVGGNEFVIYVPRKPVAAPAPAILFLHGRGESGTDGIKQTAIGLGNAIRMAAADWPFLVVMPQKPDFDLLWPNYTDRIDECLRFAESRFKIDPHRRYITGLSQGGNGTFELAGSLAWQFAAAAPVCGWIDSEGAAAKIAHIPVWVFHGDADTAVPIAKGRAAVESIRLAGGNAKLTEYPGVGHNSWDNAYQKESLGAWFLEHSLD